MTGTPSAYAIGHVFMLVEPSGAETMAKLPKRGLTHGEGTGHVRTSRTTHPVGFLIIRNAEM